MINRPNKLTIRPMRRLLIFSPHRVTVFAIIGSAAADSNELDSKVDYDHLKKILAQEVKQESLNGTLFNISLLLTKQLDNVLLSNGEDIESWVAPSDISNKFVYYLAGYDEERRPIWVAETGNWFIKDIVQQGHTKDFDLYLQQLAYRIIKSMADISTPEDPVEEVVALLDFNNLAFEQLRHRPTVSYVLDLARDFRPVINKYLGDSVIINANYATEVVLNLIRPVLGSIFERLTIFGNSKQRWSPFIVRKFMPENLPRWYGGNTNFKPLKVYGR
ncbi:unnamed protein product [Allacma fusca]|uniref:CRAL-TRIO domain-containing protein n=1 Tax=Allacma fusca TaxID=39272 RepID=A0A8J2JJH2_9HEXA|nr:unnamed protein product [Allacma fusca]